MTVPASHLRPYRLAGILNACTTTAVGTHG